MTNRQNSLFEIHSLPFCVRFMRLFVCLFGFFQFLQSLKIMRPYPVCFSRASIYFLILAYPFHTALAYGHMMNELLTYLFRGGGGEGGTMLDTWKLRLAV